MSTIFLSHSSSDAQVAAAVRDRLVAWGYRAVFLDFDPAGGIAGGRDWEQELYRNLKMARAVVALCSEPFLASRWCFAEVTQARSLGLHVFPVKVGPCTPGPPLDRLQAVDVTVEGDGAYERLRSALVRAGLDPRDDFGWDGSRPPFPGLLGFEEADAAVYFGRQPDIDRTLDRLMAAQRRGEPRLAVVFAGSGAGKSSLVRAGIIPRLRKDPERWLIVPTLRPGQRPVDELATALATAGAARAERAEWRGVRERLRAGAASAAAAVGDLATDLAIAAGTRDATVLLVVDQLEEAFTRAAPDETAAFLALVRAALDAPGSRLMVLATLRSEFLGRLQNHPAMTGLEFEGVPLGPLPASRLPEVIEGPARRAALELEAGLVQTLIGDTATDDALPLLAFTLRRLYDRGRESGRLTLALYHDIGGIQGAVARVANELVDVERLPPVQQRALRSAFLQLVTIDEQGQLSRRAARSEEMPEPARPLLTRFVDARLLVLGEDANGAGTLEVAHESLFRVWATLANWLRDDRAFLLWRRRLRARVDAGDEYIYGAVLAEARVWVRERAGDLRPDELAFVRRSTRRSFRRRTLGALAVAAVVAVALIVAVAMRRSAMRERTMRAVVTQRLYATTLGATARALDQSFPSLALALLESQRPSGTQPDLRGFEWFLYWRSLHRERLTLRGHRREITAVAMTSDGARAATGAADGTIALWDMVPPRFVWMRKAHGDAVDALAFTPDDSQILSGGQDKTAALWDVSTGERRQLLSGHEARVRSVAMAPTGSRMATGSVDGVRLWDVATGSLLANFADPAAGMASFLDFSRDGTFIGVGRTGLRDADMQLWRVDGATPELVTTVRGDPVAVRFSPLRDELYLLPRDGHGSVLAVNGTTAAPVDDIELGAKAGFGPVALSPKGRLIATVDASNLRLWRFTRHPADELHAVDEAEFVGVLRGHLGNIEAVSFSDNGRTILSGGAVPNDIPTMVPALGEAKLWDTAVMEPLTVSTAQPDELGGVQEVAFSPDSQRLAVASEHAPVRLLDVESGVLGPPLPDTRGVDAIAFAEDGRLFGASENGRLVAWKGELHELMPGPPPGRRTETPRSGDTPPFHHLAAIGVSSDGHLLAAADWLGPPVLWRGGTAFETLPLDNASDGTRSIAISPTGDLVAAGDGQGRILLWNAVTREALGTLPAAPAQPAHRGWIASLAFSRDGRTLAAASFDGDATLWDVSERREKARLRGHRDYVRAVALSPDGRTVASGSSDGTVRLWSSATGDEVGVLERADREQGGERWVTAVTFAPDGRRLAAGTRDGVVIVWRAVSREEADAKDTPRVIVAPASVE